MAVATSRSAALLAQKLQREGITHPHVLAAIANTPRHLFVEAVLAHEVSHIANGDMVTLTLIQGVVNTFVIFLARLVAGMLNNNGNNNQGGGLAYFATVIVLELVFGVLASIIVMWFSRQREYRADAGAAKLEGNPNKMIAALERLKHNHESRLEGSMMAFGIAGGGKKSELFLSHPPLEKRIAALRSQQF